MVESAMSRVGPGTAGAGLLADRGDAAVVDDSWVHDHAIADLETVDAIA